MDGVVNNFSPFGLPIKNRQLTYSSEGVVNNFAPFGLPIKNRKWTYSWGRVVNNFFPFNLLIKIMHENIKINFIVLSLLSIFKLLLLQNGKKKTL